MKIRFLGAAQTVTGSCHLLEVGNKRIMVDCGMFQGRRPIRERNYQDFLISPKEIDCVLLTHAHIDHSGLLPKLVKNGFNGPIYATQATGDLLEFMLPDSGHIQEVEVERKNRKARRAGKKLIEPIYTVDDAYEAITFVRKIKYNEVFSVDSNITARFLDAGHILGSAILELWVIDESGQTKLVFTGDMGNLNAPFVNDPAFVEEADYVIMESTYGNRLHKDRKNKLEMLREVIIETYEKGGNLVIPAFAVERTQDLLYDINQLARAGQLPPMQIYIDSPMAVAATNVFKKHPECFDQETRRLMQEGFDPLDLPGLTFSVSAEQSKAINEIASGAIILSASGMCDAGRIKHHLKHNLWRPESTVLFVGFQAPGTKGQRLLSGENSIRIHGEEIAVRADIRNIDGFSAHADQEGLLNWVKKFKKKPKKIFVVHGEPESSAVLADLITKETGTEAAVPVWQQEVILTPEYETSVNRDDIQKAHKAVSEKLEMLLNSGSGDEQYTEIMNQLNKLYKYLDICNK